MIICVQLMFVVPHYAVLVIVILVCSFIDGDVDISIEEMNFRAIWTPGHTVGMLIDVKETIYCNYHS